MRRNRQIFFFFFANNYQARNVPEGPVPFFSRSKQFTKKKKKMKYHEAARPHIFGSM